MKNTSTLRLLFFSVGLIAVIALTGMNIVSLYELRESTIEAAKDNKKNYIEEFTSQVRYRFFEPFRGLRKLNMEHIEEVYERTGDFPIKFKQVLQEASKDSIFGDIYFSPHNFDHCQDTNQPIFKFDPQLNQIVQTDQVEELVCDGMGLARSRMKVLIDDYRWNNKVTFDTHRSMTLSMINLVSNRLIGHLTFVIDRDYLVNDFFEPGLKEKFGPASESGIVVWLRDWMLDEILVISDEDALELEGQLQVDIRQRFPDLLDNWALYGQFVESPTVAASNASLYRNLFVLGAAVLSLFGALLFMYITAKRERELAQRQAGFLANVTHELKTPLAAMQAAGENLADGRVTDGERLKSYGTHIYNETIRLRKMIEKLLDVAREDSGQTMVQKAPHKLEELVKSYYNSHKNYVISKGFDFTLKSEEELPLVMVDPDHIETILSNLVENAIKYSPGHKSIRIEVKRANKKVQMKITDRGIGIPGKQQDQIFEKFYRIEDSLTARTKGHGLGLSIVKNLVELNSGEIYVISKPGTGTSFVVNFPVFMESSEKQKSHYDNVSKVEANEYAQ